MTLVAETKVEIEEKRKVDVAPLVERRQSAEPPS